MSYMNTLKGLYNIRGAEEHVKTYRPQLLVLSGKSVKHEGSSEQNSKPEIGIFL